VDGGRGRRDTLSACVPGTMWGTASSKTAKFKVGAVPGSPETQAFTPLSVGRSGGPQSACLTPPSHQCAAAASASARYAVKPQNRRIDADSNRRRQLWRSLKYEEVYIKAYGSVPEARGGIGGWLTFYNEKRPHQALDYRTPRAVHEAEACEYVDNASASLRDASALPTYSQAHHQEKEVIMY